MSKKALPNDRYLNELTGGSSGLGYEEGGGGSSVVDIKKKKGGQNGIGSTSVTRCCQAEKCTSDLGEAKQYHRRHRVCEFHARAQAVVVAGVHQRFCQQCSRFHELSEFDESKRSCRRRLAGHNERRRKNTMEYKGTGKELVCVQNDDRGRFQMAIQDNANYKHLQTR
ncbi:squamosa promoter-binding-like protein 3 [Rutidosis leptorrhynchoides]|uniref:squamosa promoter-binding-like protein 3 n=1 Tax=Rutidosis leptorrhynchoides TaxID=125765 RepID=UPI003A99B0AB